MNREIKYKAWLKKEYYSVLNPENKVYNVENLDFDTQQAYLSECGWYDFEDIELMECIGFEDKNGNEIYDGYIVKHFYEYENNGEIFETEELLIIEYQKEWGQYILRKANDKDGNWYGFYEVELDYLEVIGNIYENPELLTA